MALCVLENISKTYRLGENVVHVLKGVTLAIEPGEFVAIMGSSGSGKTTLMNILGCLDTPTSGRYRLGDREVSALQDDELSTIRNGHIGFVFQNFSLLSYITVLENVLLPTVYSPKRPDGHRERAMELLDLVGLQGKAPFRPNQLSGGQQQRVAIARAIINDPELLLADEPTGQLDSATSREIMGIFSDLNARGKTVVIVTHDPSIAGFARRTIRIEDGRIVNT